MTEGFCDAWKTPPPFFRLLDSAELPDVVARDEDTASTTPFVLVFDLLNIICRLNDP